MTDRQTTHAPGCWEWGPRHYECALREIEALRAENELLHKRCQQAYAVGRESGREDDETLLRQALDVLFWTTGSKDFGEGGLAREGALKALFPTIAALRERLVEKA